MSEIFQILQNTLDSGRICGKQPMSPEEWLRNIPGHERAIKDLFLELIGKDEQIEHRRAERDGEANGANDLRADLRKKVEEL